MYINKKNLIESKVLDFVNYIKGENKYAKISYSYLGDIPV